MGKPWTEKLAPSKVSLMNEIVAQVPEEHGARDAFIGILQDLADAPADPKFRYIFAKSDGGDVTGSNVENHARAMAGDECTYVIDVVEMKWLCSPEESDDSDIVEEQP